MKKRLFACALAVAITCLSVCTPVYATSKSRTTSSSALSASLTANAWIQSFADLDGSGEFQVSAAYYSISAAFKRPEWIETSWEFYAYGIGAGVEYKSITGSIEATPDVHPKSGSWRNENCADYAWMRGRVNGTGLWFYIGLINTATAFKSGVIMSTSAKI